MMPKFRYSIENLAALTLLVLSLFGAPSYAAEQPVVLELFTSEGCSSCPPADALLGQLSQQRTGHGVELILLGEHVEYWNGPGWKDRFSAPVFTERQNDYVRSLHLATAYTPQLIVDGHLQTVGGNGPEIKRIIAESSRTQKTATVSLKLLSPDKLQVSVSAPKDAKLSLSLAITEDNLTTKIGGGENQGRTLTHTAVVRELRSIGKTNDGQFEKTVSLSTMSDWKKPDLRVIVLAQDQNSRAILGAASVPLLGGNEVAATRR